MLSLQDQLKSEMIVATSGFILPANNYFYEFEPDSDIDDILNRSIVVNNSTVHEFYKKQDVYKSESISKVYKDYITNKSFDNYIKLLDISMDILKDINCELFFKMQLTNRYLSPISLNFCKDLLTVTNKPSSRIRNYTEGFVSCARGYYSPPSYYGVAEEIKFLETYKNYAILPFNLRFTLHNDLTEKEIKDQIFDFSKKTKHQTWSGLLSTLFLKPSTFEVFFRYIFVDQY